MTAQWKQHPGPRWRGVRPAARHMATPFLFTAMLAAFACAPSAAFAQDSTPTPVATPARDCPALPADVASPFAYYTGFGAVQFSRAFYSQAANSYSCALDLEPNRASTLASRGYAYAALGDSTSALADYEASLALDELYLPAYINRGALYTQLGNFGLAINDLTLALSFDASNVTALNNRAIVHAIEGNTELALADLTTALAISPQTPLLYATRAAVYSQLAARDYARYAETSESTRLPAGTPTEVLVAVDDGLRTGDFSIWLSLLAPAIQAAD